MQGTVSYFEPVDLYACRTWLSLQPAWYEQAACDWACADGDSEVQRHRCHHEFIFSFHSFHIIIDSSARSRIYVTATRVIRRSCTYCSNFKDVLILPEIYLACPSCHKCWMWVVVQRAVSTENVASTHNRPVTVESWAHCGTFCKTSWPGRRDWRFVCLNDQFKDDFGL